MFNAETSKLRKQVADLTQSLTETKTSFEQQLAAARTAETKPSKLTQQQIEEFGQETIDMMRSVANEEAAAATQYARKLEEELRTLKNMLSTQVQPQVQHLATSHQQATEARFFAELDQLVPSWSAINDNPAFHDWLMDQDPFSGHTRDAMLKAAASSFDSRRAANFFSTFLAMVSAGQQGGQQGGQPDNRVNARQKELENAITPGKARSGGQQAPEKPTFTRAQTEDFFRDARNGAYRNKPEEKDRKYAEIMLAFQEGRVVN
jgi:hypothetical protein